ncbi:hypothetical protein, partial [Gordonibacter sp.]
ALSLAGCSQGEGGKQDDGKQEEAVQQEAAPTYETTPSDKLGSMSVGETAVFDGYEVTVSAVDIADTAVTAHVKIKAHESDQALKTKYLEGGSQSETSFPDGKIAVPAGSEVEGTISYSNTSLKELRWNNWSMEATWKFENAAGDAAAAETDALRTAHDSAVENAKQYFDVPNSVDFPWVDFAQERTGETITETGTVKYKNAYGTKIEEQYWLIYDDSGALTTFKLGDLSLI